MKYLLMPFAWLLMFFYNLFNNYGLAIILFALVVKVVLFPFALKGKRSMVKMSALTGKQQRLQKQYANNKEKYNAELTALYEREQVNPMSGCLWSFVPLLVLIPLYAILRQPLLYMMDATTEQINTLLTTLNWSGAAAANGWTADFAKAPTGSSSLRPSSPRPTLRRSRPYSPRLLRSTLTFSASVWPSSPSGRSGSCLSHGTTSGCSSCPSCLRPSACCSPS